MQRRASTLPKFDNAQSHWRPAVKRFHTKEAGRFWELFGSGLVARSAAKNTEFSADTG